MQFVTIPSTVSWDNRPIVPLDNPEKLKDIVATTYDTQPTEQHLKDITACDIDGLDVYFAFAVQNKICAIQVCGPSGSIRANSVSELIDVISGMNGKPNFRFIKPSL